MGSAWEIVIQIRKVLIISMRECYRSVCNHPFLVGLLGFLIFLYRCFPFVFSILVSASPVLVCTAVLLGTLLSFGNTNIPEVEKEEEVTHGISSFQTSFSEVATVIAEKDESFVEKTHTENRSVIQDRSIEEASLAGDKVVNVEQGDSLVYYVPLIDEISQDFQNEKQESEQMDREFFSFELEKQKDHVEKLKAEAVSSDDEAIEKQYIFVQKVNNDILDSENENTAVEPLQTFEGDDLDFSPSSSWKQVEKNEEEDYLESGSDKAESSSPDASMADIIPMLDELHPLLDLEASQTAHLSHDGSVASEKTQQSDDGSVESDEDTENRVEVEEDGVDEHEDEEEEEVEGGREDESKSAIKWTEDDQQNLMDLGTLELERNQRLENLIARRRARRMMTEKNLIDFESADLPFNIAPIATTRRNPFDLPDDSYAGMGLPPIPGSAPSVLQPRRNPFDIPYDPNEEKPDLKGDSFQQEFMMFNQKDTLFRRYESFSRGPSVLGTTKHGRQDFNWKPIFVLERMASEGTSYAPFQRQSSELSDSKLSSVHDTESVTSTDQDDQKLNDQDLSQETEIISNIDHISACVEHGSQSSGEIDSVEMIHVDESNVHHVEVEIVLGGMQNLSEMELYSETGEVAVHEEFNTGENETHLGGEPVHEESSCRSNRSSLSEVIDNLPDDEREKSESLQLGDNHLQDSRVSTRDSVEEVDFPNVRGGVENNQHREPLYDSSSPAAGMVLSFASLPSDSATEFSERVLTPPPAEMTANVTDKESEVLDQNLEDNTSGHEGAVELFAVAPSFVEQKAPSAPESLVMQPVSVDSTLSLDVGSIKAETNTGFLHEQEQADHLYAESKILKDNSDEPSSDCQVAFENSQTSMNESVEEGAVLYGVNSSRFDDENMSEVVQHAEEKLDLVASYSQHMPSSDSSLSTPQELQPSLVAERAPGAHRNPPIPRTRLQTAKKARPLVSFPATRTKYHTLPSLHHSWENKLRNSNKFSIRLFHQHETIFFFLMISYEIYSFCTPFRVLRSSPWRRTNMGLLIFLPSKRNMSFFPSIVCSSVSGESFSLPKPNQLGYSQELFGLEVELKPRKAGSQTSEPRSWFGPNGQYIRELPCPSCRGRGYTPCTDCGIERSRLDCPKCSGKGIVTCHQCSGDCVTWEESIDEQPWERARSISPLKVQEDDEVDNLDIKLDVKKKSKRVYQSPPPEVGLKISRSLKSLNEKTGLFSKRMKIIHRNPMLHAQRVAAIKKTKGTAAARKRSSETMKAFFSNPENRLKRSIAMKGVNFFCQNCGREGHRRHYCPELKDSLIHRQFTCGLCGEKGHNRRTCSKLRISHSNGRLIKHHRCKICRQYGHNSRTCPLAAASNTRRDLASRRTYKCRLCHKKGHNIRTCPRRVITEHPSD